MGVDFIHQAEKAFRKQWDRGLRSLRTPDLFRRTPKLHERRFAAFPTNGVRLQAGQTYSGALEGDEVVVFQANSRIARVSNIPLSIQNQIRNQGCGFVVVNVQAVQPVSGAADVTIR